MKKSTQVNKSLTPEEKVILGNIKSLLEQLDSEDISEDMNAPATDEAVEESADEEPLVEEEEVVEKSATPDEVANNDAEERMCAEDTDTEKALAVLKSLLSKRKVNKSADYARLEAKVDSLTSAVENMIDGFGFVQTPAPVQKSSRVLKSYSAKQREEDLSDVLTTLFK